MKQNTNHPDAPNLSDLEYICFETWWNDQRENNYYATDDARAIALKAWEDSLSLIPWIARG
jgi:hypothetical protein